MCLFGSSHTRSHSSLVSPQSYHLVLMYIFCLLLVLLSSPAQAASLNPFKFQHTPPTTVAQGRSLTLIAKAENNDDLEDVYLYYRQPKWKRYRFLKMQLFGGDRYRVTLPIQVIIQPAIEYYIVGSDVSNKTHFLFASSTHPHRVQVKYPTSPQRSSGGLSRKEIASTSSRSKPIVTRDEELVYSASRREQRVQTAPAVVTVITEGEIQAGGYRTVLELLRYVVGMSINNNGHWADIGMRGLNPRVGYGDKLLILLDGHNMSWRQFNRNYLNPSWVSVDNIKRIEIIRGPGSAMWGANAISGVINIITKTASSLNGIEFSGGLGTLSKTYFLTLQGGQELYRGLRFRASFSLHRENRSPILAPIREFLLLNDSDYRYLNNNTTTGKSYDRTRYVPKGDEYFAQTFYAWLTWRGVSLSFHQSRYDPSAPLSTFSKIGGDDSRFVTDRYFTKLSWTTALSTWGTMLLWASFDHYQFAQGTAYEANPFDAKARSLVKMNARDARFETGAQFSAMLFPFLTLSTGLDFEYIDLIRWNFPQVLIQNKLPIPQFTNFHFSAFAQAQLSIQKIVEFTAGGRLDYDQRYGLVFTPRLAATFTPGHGLYLKALYGNAFKAPSFNDLYYFRANAFYGNPTLRPESVNTMELQVGWSKRRRISVSLNGYLSLFENVIAYATREKDQTITAPNAFPRSQLPNGSDSYQQKDNTSALTLYGGELEFRVYPIKGLQIHGGFGVFFGHIGTLTKPKGELTYTARWSGNLTASYRFQTGPLRWLVSMGGVFVGPKPVPATAFKESNGQFATNTQGKPIYLPYWTNDPTAAARKGIPLDPTTSTPTYIRTFMTVQLLQLLRHIDIIVRLDNFLNLDLYDAGRDFLYPQKKLDLMLHLRIKY